MVNHMLEILKNTDHLLDHIRQTAGEHIVNELTLPTEMPELADASAVLFLLGLAPFQNGSVPEPCLILNKRSDRVKQSGDLCCPGGGVMPGIDALLARAMTLPGLPMWHWPYWPKLKAKDPHQADILRLLFFTSVRESFEEMRLNPFGVRFLGPLPSQQLVMFRKIIYPMMGWVSGQKRFLPNWEVEKIVYLPLRKLLDPENYVRYRLYVRTPGSGRERQCVYDAPGYVHKNHKEEEILWGATCKITLKFLKRMFDFSPPDIISLPVVEDVMDENYANAA
jgi:hypothetical protein